MFYAKLKLKTENYDIITPTDYIIARMIKNDLVQKLNFDLLPAAKNNIDPFFFRLIKKILPICHELDDGACIFNGKYSFNMLLILAVIITTIILKRLI